MIASKSKGSQAGKQQHRVDLVSNVETIIETLNSVTNYDDTAREVEYVGLGGGSPGGGRPGDHRDSGTLPHRPR